MKWNWPYLRSFLTEKVVESISTPHHDLLEVWYVYGKYTLNSRSVNFSYGDLDKVFRQAFYQLNISDRKVESCLILGFGVGNVCRILREYHPDSQVVGVEIDEKIIGLGRNYFDLDTYENMEIVVAEATEYMSVCEAKFDLIIVDLFIDALVPNQAESGAFLEKLDEQLQPGGLLLFNRMMHSPGLRQQSEAFTRKIQAVLPITHFCKAHQNRMLYHEKKK